MGRVMCRTSGVASPVVSFGSSGSCWASRWYAANYAAGGVHKRLNRFAEAEGYLRENRFSLSEITYLLGFSDQANFGRAFKRWRGQTPRAYRLAARS